MRKKKKNNRQRKMKKQIKEMIGQNRIRPGMVREELRDLLGEPHDMGMSTRKSGIPMIWKYETIEFHWLPRSDGLWLVIEAEDPEYHETLLVDKHE